jgi:type IX secretion system substrate protein
VVTVNPLPEFVLGNDTSICCNYQLVLDAPEGYVSYLWSDLSTGMEINIDSTGAGIGTKEVWLIVEDENGCTGTSYLNVTFTECLSIDENLLGLDLNLYPVPVKDLLFIELKAENEIILDLWITDAKGQVVFEENNVTMAGFVKKSINLSKLEKGIYFLTLENEKARLNRKIIVN